MNIPPLQPPSPDPDPLFTSDEKLYHAVRKRHVQAGTTILPDAIRLPSISCNREKYCSCPESVLAIFRDKPEEEYIYVAVLVAGNLPPPASVNEEVFWEFLIAHIPLLDNYSHSEVRVGRRGGQYDGKVTGSAVLKLKLRTLLAGKMCILSDSAPAS